MNSSIWRDTAGVVAGVAILMWVMPLFISTYTLTILIIYGILALSLGLIWGFGGILCFGQAAFFGLGAYVYAISAINFGESTVPMILSVVIPAIFAGLLGAMMFYGRLNDVYFAVITLVVTLILFKFMNSTAGPEYVIGNARLGGFNGIPGFQTLNVPGRPDSYIWGDQYFFFCAIVSGIIYLAVIALLKSSFGRIAIGIRENETRMSLLGYDVRAHKTKLFAVGAAIAGLAGALFANWAEIVTPSLFSLGQSAEIIIWCIVGGLGTRFGPVLGAAVLSYLKFLLGQQALIDNLLITGLILVFFVLILPKGIVPALVTLFQRLMGRYLLAPQKMRRRRLRRKESGA